MLLQEKRSLALDWNENGFLFFFSTVKPFAVFDCSSLPQRCACGPLPLIRPRAAIGSSNTSLLFPPTPVMPVLFGHLSPAPPRPARAPVISNRSIHPFRRSFRHRVMEAVQKLAGLPQKPPFLMEAVQNPAGLHHFRPRSRPRPAPAALRAALPQRICILTPAGMRCRASAPANA